MGEVATPLETYDHNYVLFSLLLQSSGWVGPDLSLLRATSCSHVHYYHHHFIQTDVLLEGLQVDITNSHIEIWSHGAGQGVSQGGSFYCTVSSSGSLQRHDLSSCWFQHDKNFFFRT